MKRKAIIVLLIAAVLSSLALLGGCSEKWSKVYDDNNLIITKTNYVSRANSIRNQTKTEYTETTKKFNGVWTINTLPNTETITINLKINSGSLKVVLVNAISKELYEITNEDYNDDYSFANIPDGDYHIKIVGKNANFSITVKYSQLNFID